MVVFLFNTVIYVFLLLCLMYSYCTFVYLHRARWHCSAKLAEVVHAFFLSCKAKASLKPAKPGHGPHSSKILGCSVYCVCVCVCVQMCTVLLPPGGYPIAVKKYIIHIYKVSVIPAKR